METDRTIKRGDVFFYDFGNNPGSIQCGRRPVMVLQADNFNQHAPTVIVAAITTVIKKQYMPSHIILPEDTSLEQPSMVMLEQIRAVNKADLLRYVGTLQDEARGPSVTAMTHSSRKVRTRKCFFLISAATAYGIRSRRECVRPARISSSCKIFLDIKTSPRR